MCGSIVNLLTQQNTEKINKLHRCNAVEYKTRIYKTFKGAIRISEKVEETIDTL